jgi:ADP-ribose pyrophosphatase
MLGLFLLCLANGVKHLLTFKVRKSGDSRVQDQDKESLMPFELIRSETLLKGRAFLIRRDHLKTPNGGETKLDIIEHGGSVILVPVDKDGNLLFVRQYRHAAGMDLLELPAGTLEKGEDPAVCAAREIREETGFAADKIEKIGDFYLAPGYSTEFMHVYLAQELRHDPLEADADEFLSVEKLSFAEAIQMAERGEMPDAKSLAALLLAKSHLFPK